MAAFGIVMVRYSDVIGRVMCGRVTAYSNINKNKEEQYELQEP